MAATKLAHIILCHGAGAGSESEFMQQLGKELEALNLEVTLWDFPYMVKAKALGKRRPPDRLPILLDALREQVQQVDTQLPLVLAGKSMGGRVASLLLNELALPGIAYGYPFHPMGKPEKLRVDHLKALEQPLLIIQGERDGFGTRQEVAGYGLPAGVELCWLADGDHSLKPRKASGLTQAQHIQTAAQASLAYIQEHCL